MKLLILSASCFMLFLLMKIAVAAPEGDLVIHNASDQVLTAQVSTFGKFNLAANEVKNVAYSSLEQVCSPNPTACTAQFYINNKPAGSATINAVTGKLVHMQLARKVHTTKSQQVLRSVVIQ